MGAPFAGDYWLVPRYGVAWQQTSGDSDVWVLVKANWQSKSGPFAPLAAEKLLNNLPYQAADLQLDSQSTCRLRPATFGSVFKE